jgi:uncharacterized protein YjbI with pentapeptide repeats
MSENEGRQALLPPRPTESSSDAWKTYWKGRGQPWRTEPEISAERQAELAQCRTIVPDIQRGAYPFKGMKLSRADIEWLLATHEDGRGPVDWSDENQRQHRGLDVRGADLRGAQLEGLPLACLYAGLTVEEYDQATEEQRDMAGVLLEGADLSGAQLQGAVLIGARLQKAKLCTAQLQKAFLVEAQLQEANCWKAQLHRANLRRAQLQRTDLRDVNLQEADLYRAQLQEARLRRAQLQRANLSGAKLQGALLFDTVFSDERHVGPHLVDIEWGGTTLTALDWSQIKILGDEQWCMQGERGMNEVIERFGYEAFASFLKNPQRKYQEALRANRQLSVALQNQGLNEDAARFAYRAQRLQRILLRHQRKIGQYLFSWLLDLLAGYGYRPGRSVCWYLMVIVGFAFAYHLFGGLSLFPPDAFIYSLTSFHGRGFFPGLEHTTSLHDSLVMLAALEAVVGLVIEISFIATFTQRFFGR